MYPVYVVLGKGNEVPFTCRLGLNPVSTNGTGGDNPFWTHAYGNLKRPGNKVLQRFNVDPKPHEYQVGDTVVYRMKLES